jgi:hypothetical protein
MTKHQGLLLLTLVVAGTVVGLGLWPALSQADTLPPPPPEPPDGPDPTEPPNTYRVSTSQGAQITLHLAPETEAFWRTYDWQEVWTAVQWQDRWGVWHDVWGWQGTLDEMLSGEVGAKVWWVAKSDLGKGPFRWLVYGSKSGSLVDWSEPFYLPATSGEGLIITVTP